MRKDHIKKQITATIKNKRCWLTFCSSFAVAVFIISLMMDHKEVNASLSSASSDLASIEEDVFNEELTDTHDEMWVQNDGPEEVSTEESRENTLIIQPGDTLLNILTDLGLDYNRANDIYVAFKKVYDPRKIRVGQKIRINIFWDLVDDKLISVDSLSYQRQINECVIVAKDEHGNYTAQLHKENLVEELASAEDIIDGNLSVSMNNRGVPSRVVANFIQIFSYSVDFKKDIKPGDRFKIIYETFKTPDGQLVKTGNVIFASLTLGKNDISLYRFKDSRGNIDYYDAKGFAMKKTLSRKPMSYQNARISSPFGRRLHPIYKDYRVHWGIDYAAPRNTLVYAAGDGVVQVAKYNGGYGNYIKIRHNSEYSTAYGHMQKFAKGIRPGTRVKQGQTIGYVGSTGRSTGPHLHYEVIHKGKRVNPLKVTASASENLSGRNLRNFKNKVAQMKKDYQSLFAQKSNVDRSKVASAKLDKKF